MAKRQARKAVKKAKRAPKRATKELTRKKVAAKRAAVRRAPARQARRQPESLRLRSAGPSFTVSNIRKSLAFYRDVLGFTVKQTWERDGELSGAELVAGSVTFWLGQDDWQKGRDRVKGKGFRMYCGTTQNVDLVARQIRERGGTLAEGPKDQPWGGRDFAIVDPDGFKITIASGL